MLSSTVRTIGWLTRGIVCLVLACVGTVFRQEHKTRVVKRLETELAYIESRIPSIIKLYIYNRVVVIC
jgi:hypothetical protein